MNQPLHAPLEISFDYTRSLGPTLSAFMTAVADRRILGARASDGQVHALRGAGESARTRC